MKTTPLKRSLSGEQKLFSVLLTPEMAIRNRGDDTLEDKTHTRGQTVTAFRPDFHQIFAGCRTSKLKGELTTSKEGPSVR
jgi:hypothetical protein